METGCGSGLLADTVCQRQSTIDGHQSDRGRHRKAKGTAGYQKWKGSYFSEQPSVLILLMRFYLGTQNDGKDTIDELDEWAGIQFTIDNETGKYTLAQYIYDLLHKVCKCLVDICLKQWLECILNYEYYSKRVNSPQLFRRFCAKRYWSPQRNTTVSRVWVHITYV